jgi:NADPH-dependent glutamate synthase beta subunit-like oxidoreductase
MGAVYDTDRLAAGDAHFVPAPCQVACPVGTDAPSYIAYIWEGRLAEALEAITATNPFSSICGRVCDAPCEPACRRADADGPLAIRNLKRFVMDELGASFRLPAVAVTRGETVGIVGAGPAGLTAAHDLAEAGYEVHVYEMTDRAGGMMAWGIPAFRLSPGIIEEDLDRILAHCPGIKVHLNTALGRDVTLDELKERHDAVLLAIGAWWGKTIEIPGADDARVIDGVGFLRRVNAGARPALPETVCVIGGGDVAMDACRVARRLPGCTTVRVVYRRAESEMPARRDELAGAIREGVEFVTNTLPVAVAVDGERLALRCLRTEPGEREGDGRRRPVAVPGSEHDVACGLVIVAVGQKAACAELDESGLMMRDRVSADFATMRTADPKVFAAGDGTFGGSTIVMAMHHGQRAAYYVKAYLEGRASPLPYRTPYRTRRVAVAQDPLWEVIGRQHQAFHGLGDDPSAFAEIESGYDPETAKAEAARCYRCDAETGTHDYSVRNREDIFVMARTEPDDVRSQRAILAKRLEPRAPPHDQDAPASLEDLVFLPANLSRLVIDPYRDDCNLATALAGTELAFPLIVGGFDDAPDEVRAALAEGLAAAGCAYFGRRALPGAVPWLQLVGPGEGASAEAAAAIRLLADADEPFAAERRTRGVVARAGELERVLPRALEAGLELLVLDATGGLGRPWVELEAPPDLTVLRDAIRLLRALNREEDIELVYFGGVRSGTDVAKVLGLGCRAAILGVAAGLAMGGTIEGGLVFRSELTPERRSRNLANLLRACAGETSIMARCTGKTDVHNLEPEDLCSISIATSLATGIPLAGTGRVAGAE